MDVCFGPIWPGYLRPMVRSQTVRAFVEEVGDIASFTGRFFREVFRPRYEWAELLRQRFDKAVGRHGLDRKRVELDLSQFRADPSPGPTQGSLF